MTQQGTTTGNPNDIAFKLFEGAIRQSERLGICIERIGDSKVLDFAVDREGTTEAGILLSQICMGGLGEVEMLESIGDLPLPQVRVKTDLPLLACIGSQYAGWPISHEQFFAMGSGPMRMPRGREEVLLAYKLKQQARRAVGVLECNEIPGEDVIQLMATECNVHPNELYLCVARTASYPGSFQVVARSVEVAMHKLHELKFDLNGVVAGTGFAPLPPVAKDDMTALGWTNDSMLYGAKVELTVETSDEAIERIFERIPSSSSSDFGTPFLEIFNRYDKDFYKIDKMLFSPAEIVITNRTTGGVFRFGEIRNDILKLSFGI